MDRIKSCDECGKTFASICDVTVHTGEHNKDFYVCKSCEKMVGNESELCEHSEKHRATLLVKCDKCDERFLNKEQLATHLIIHKEELEDVWLGKVQMEDTDEEKYLGDIISKDGRNIKNIKARVNKGKGIVKRILDILEGIPFGQLYFQVAILLRNCLLVSSVLCNSETWFNLTLAELELLESVDLMLLRTLLATPKSTPKEMFYLELGLLPFREIIRQRRLNFLHYILNQDAESIIFKVFEKQTQEKHKRYWVSCVLLDLEDVKLNPTFVEIQ